MAAGRIRNSPNLICFWHIYSNSSKVSECLDLRLLNFSLFRFFITKVFEVFFQFFSQVDLWLVFRLVCMLYDLNYYNIVTIHCIYALVCLCALLFHTAHWTGFTIIICTRTGFFDKNIFKQLLYICTEKLSNNMRI